MQIVIQESWNCAQDIYNISFDLAKSAVVLGEMLCFSDWYVA